MKASNSRTASPTGRSKMKSSKSTAVTFSNFTPDHSLNEVDRAAQFLDWAALNMPMRFVPYTWVAKHAIIRPRIPGPDSPEVVMIRKKIGAIKRSLWDRYNRRTVAAPRNQDQEMGIRATVDDDDVAGTDFLQNKRRIHNGIRRLEDTRSKIDPSRMRDHGLKAMVTSMDTVMKKLTQSDLMTRLKELPSRPVDDD